MKNPALFLFICLCCFTASVIGQNSAYTAVVNDGPYIFYVNDTLKVKQIDHNTLREYSFPPENYSATNNGFHLSCSYKDLLNVFSEKANYKQNFNQVDSILAISDVHGQYKKYTDLLQANGVLDKDLNWKFGKGHLVFIGDAFDRGDRVTEILWHLFTLEKQAAKAGGMVHVLLGNHDNMVMCGDLRYMNEKYRKVEELTGTRYSDLYSEKSVLGKWLRAQPVIISINDIIFVHAGISNELPRNKLTIKKANKLFSTRIIGKEALPQDVDEDVKLLDGDKGPLWYRGYFEDSTFSELKTDSILSFYSKKHIVTGHTTFKNIKALFGSKIIGIDAGIGYKQPGEVLIYKTGNFYVGTSTGERIKFDR